MSTTLLDQIRGGLVVSCQAGDPNSPVYGPVFMAAFARCAELGGAVGLRVNGPADVAACRKATKLPIIGIYKLRTEEFPVYITPTLEAARQIKEAGADIIAIDATHRPRAGGLMPEALIRAIQTELRCPVMADIDSLEEGLAAAAGGADIVATTMSGYTPARPTSDGPDLDLLRQLAERIQTPLICEGRVQRPEHLRAALDAGAFAVVVGTAITNPIAITEAYVRASDRPANKGK